MALNTHMSIASWDLALDSALNVLNGGYIEIYTGTQPATPDIPPSGGNTLLVTLPLSATAFGAASAGTKTANAITSATAVATGTATWFRAYESNDTTAVIDGSVGASSADMILISTLISSGALTQVSSWFVAMPIGQ